ncbi:MAG: amino acid kinase family protein, partial [Flavisolibacter sp.]
KNIVAQLQAWGCNALGLTGADGNALLAHKRVHAAVDYGLAGDVDAVNARLFTTLLEQDISLVIAPLTHDKKGQLLNTNADTVAREIARGLGHRYDVSLVYSFEKQGVLLNAADEDSVIGEITPAYYKDLKEKKLVFAGMIPKLDNAFAALNSGVRKVIIGKAENIHELLAGTSGTTIINE